MAAITHGVSLPHLTAESQCDLDYRQAARAFAGEACGLRNGKECCAMSPGVVACPGGLYVRGGYRSDPGSPSLGSPSAAATANGDVHGEIHMAFLLGNAGQIAHCFNAEDLLARRRHEHDRSGLLPLQLRLINARLGPPERRLHLGFLVHT